MHRAGQIQNEEQNFNPGLALIGLSGTEQRPVNCSQERSLMLTRQRG